MPRTQIERMWIIGASMLGGVLVLITYFFFISPQRSDTSSVDGQVASVRTSNNALQSRITVLSKQYSNLKTYQTALAHARLALPAASGIPDFLRTLQAIGNATGTDVSALTVGTPVGISAGNPVTPSTAAATNPTAAATAAPGANAPEAATLNTAVGAVYALPIAAQVSGSTKALDAFLTQLQKIQPRAVLINQITETVGGSTGAGAASGTTTAGTTALQINMQAFVAPTDASVVASLSQAAGK